ncbi:MAG TPA: VCBS repeat-containing protein, partial [Acidobacteriota bacterium]|nr:VCBS repeat-containing protein [Acidobacteriota bacterium]
MNKRNNFIALSVFIALLAVAAGSRFSVTANSTAAQPVWQKSRQVAVPLPQYAAFDLESASDLVTVAAGPSVVRYADVDGDGIADLIAVKNGNLHLQRGQAATEFGLPEILETGSSTTALAVGDINGDGYPELLALNASNSTVTVWG